MKYFLASTFALGASAGVLKQRAASSCCFGINVNGGYQSGSLGQLNDGQNRVGQDFGNASYCLTGTTIYDEAGRGCVIAQPSTQFQCDLNSVATSGFAVSSTGEISYNGNTTFYECAATANMQFNIYTTPAGAYCTEVTLSTSGGSCAASSSASSAVPSTVYRTTTAPASTVTIPGAVSTVTAPGTTVTVPASTVTMSEAGSTGTITISEAGSTGTVTITIPASTVTVSGAGSTGTVTISGAGQTLTLPASTVTVSSVESCAASTVTISSVESCTASTVYSTLTATVTATISGAGKTVVQTAEVTEVETAAPVTVVQTAEVTKTAEITEVATQTAEVTIVETAVPSTIVEIAPASTVVESTTVVETVSAAPTTVVSVATTSVFATTSVAASTSASATATSTSCPADLSGSYQYPHLIIPVNSSSPNTAYGTQYFGQVSSTVSTIFNFDIPASYQGNTCSLIFLLPTKAELETSDYTVSGTGDIEVLQLSSAATSATTYANQPSVEADLGSFDIAVGSSTVIATTACAAGETVTYELKATGSYALYFFEDWNPSPLGLFIRECS